MALAVGNCVPAMAAPTGWRESAAGWQYVNSNGSVQKGWFQDTKGDWYFLDYNTGIMKTGWIKPKDGKWYFMDYHTGAMKTGWIKPADGKWYYLNPNSNGTKGAMMTGWVQTPDKKWYYMDAASGAMQTGTITVNNQVWTLDANGVWDGKAATSITYVSSNRRPSGGSSGGGSGTVKPTDKGYEIKDGNVEITSKDYNKDKLSKETIKNLTINVQLGEEDAIDVSGIKVSGDLYITDAVGEGTVTLDGVTVEGETVVGGGGTESVHFKKCVLSKVRTNKSDKEGVKPLRIAFEAETQVVEVTIGGGTVILNTVITIPKLIVNSPLVVEGKEVKVDNFIIQKMVPVVVKVNIGLLTIDKAAEGAPIKVEGIVDKVDGEGNAEISGSGTVVGYYNVTLNAGEGSWTITEMDDKGVETPKTLSTKIIKANPDGTLGDVIKSAGDPSKEGSTFAGWYKAKDFTGEVVKPEDPVGEADIELYAKWDEAKPTEITPVVSSITATIASGSSVTVDSGEINVTDGAATLNLTTATGSSVTATGAAVLADIKLEATAKNGETPVTGTITWNDANASTTEIKSNTTYSATFTAISTGTTEIYTPVPIKITIVIK